MAYSHEDANQPFRSRLEFVADRDGQFNALAAWFRAQLTKQIVLCNGPLGTRYPVGTLHLPRGKNRLRREGDAGGCSLWS